MNNIILLFGGDSCERDISVITAVQLYENIDRSKYNVIPIYMYEGSMYRVSRMKVDTFIDYVPRAYSKVYLSDSKVYLHRKLLGYKSIKVDIALLANHGGNGENGELQGLLDIAHIPYTSPGVLSSSILMDKVTTKIVLRGLGISSLPYKVVSNLQTDYVNIVNSLKFPIIVKPARLGSSIGVRVVESEEGLASAVELSSYYDDKVIVEHALEDFEEYNIALYKKNGEMIFSAIESPNMSGKLLDFDEKYGSNGKMDDIAWTDDSMLGDSQIEYMKRSAEKIYRALDMKGVVRIDYLVKDAKVYVNEVNTIPGSLAYYLFERVGITYSEIIDDIIDEGLRERDNRANLIRYYKSSVLKNAKNVGNKLRK